MSDLQVYLGDHNINKDNSGESVFEAIEWINVIIYINSNIIRN